MTTLQSDEQRIADTLVAWASTAPYGDTVLSAREAATFAALARTLDFACDSYYAECRLGASRQLDLLLSFDRNNPRLAELPARLAEFAKNSTGNSRQAWCAAQAFVERWIALDDPLHHVVGAIWLEFDDVLVPQAAVAPSLSACIIPDYGSHYQPRQESHLNTAEALCAAYSALCPSAGDEVVKQLIGEVTDALPGGGRFIHLSWMGARQCPAVKLYGVLPRSQLLAYLQRIGFSGPLDALEIVLASIATREQCGDDIYLDLNLTTLRDPQRCSVGIAFSQQQVRACLPEDRSRRALLEQLATQGQCRPAQARALAAWAEPPLSAAGTGRALPHVRRWLDVKSVLDAQCVLQTKAYLGFGPLRTPFVIKAA